MSPPPQLWSTLHHPLLRDLAWAVFSPSLIRSANDQIDLGFPPPNTDDLQFLTQLDQNPTALEEWMEGCKSPRLGLRFEYLWQFWINRSRPSIVSNDWENLFNLQINSDQRTLGELDSVSYSPSRATVIHREFAVKFYLGINSDELPPSIRPDMPFCWVGPNVKDRLDLKRAQLLNQQLQLMDKVEAKQVLPNHWRWSRLQRQALVRGRLYYPFDGQQLTPSDQTFTHDSIKQSNIDWSIIGDQHQRGYWLPLATLPQLEAEHWAVLNRHQWFAPLRINFNDSEGSTIFNRNELGSLLETHFLSQTQPIQIAAMSQRDNCWEESVRYFVVPNQWPSITDPLRNT